MLHLWRKIFFDKGNDAFVGKGDLNPEDAELKRLRKELEDVKEERDILKKALAVFSKYLIYSEKHIIGRLESV
jgi:transposase